MTFEEYINNPAGKGASNTPNKDMYRQYYTSQLDNLLLKENGKIKYNLYINGEKYYILFNIPHSKYQNLFYEVLVDMKTQNHYMF